MVSYPEHLPHFDYRGFNRYFLTFCTFERNRLFTDAADVELVTAQFLRASSECDVAVIAYCFMPDHVHLLVEGAREDADVKAFISSTRGSISNRGRARTCGSAMDSSGRCGRTRTPKQWRGISLPIQ